MHYSHDESAVKEGSFAKTRYATGLSNNCLCGVFTLHPSYVDRYVLWYVPSHGRYLAKHEFSADDTRYVSSLLTRVDYDEEQDIITEMSNVPLSPRATCDELLVYELYIKPLFMRLNQKLFEY